jgi:1-deoxy-D-xylulose-5-phosphate synthase
MRCLFRRIVGAMSQYLNKIRTAPCMTKKRKMWKTFKNIPGIGSTVAKAAGKAKDGIKYFLVPVCFLKNSASLT